ncbi:uncharacterized protein LOC130793965 [Actinidia eriantha]|uniref:uncharacterized protein LOC130793965 n=1 Tax=Actinidia eriantha TaxID=165200 RepID=UPI00258E4292|nr:uncharacterized protein LOC130793965 [Actinidia eriantha]
MDRCVLQNDIHTILKARTISMGVSITTPIGILWHSSILRSCVVSSSSAANKRFVIVGGVSAAWVFFKHGKANRKLCSIQSGLLVSYPYLRDPSLLDVVLKADMLIGDCFVYELPCCAPWVGKIVDHLHKLDKVTSVYGLLSVVISRAFDVYHCHK